MKQLNKTLKNGMRVSLLHKPDFNRSVFLIHVPAGGRRLSEYVDGKKQQHPGGCAHYLEHQMFRLNGEDVTYALGRLGAASNAYTDADSTCYYVASCVKPMESLQILIDFVQTLDIDDKSVEKEKGIILSEYWQYEQAPEYALQKMVWKGLYHNPLSCQDVLGEPEDIENMTVEHLRSFYSAWYDPSSLVLTGVTGLDLEMVMDAIEQMEQAYPSAMEQAAVDGECFEEPASIHIEHQTRSMDTMDPSCIFGIKLDFEPDWNKAVIPVFFLSLYLDAFFGPLNPQLDEWIEQGIVLGGLSSYVQIDDKRAEGVVTCLSSRPEEFLAKARQILTEKPEISQEAFDSLKISFLGDLIRQREDFISLAAETAEAIVHDYDYLHQDELIRPLTREDLMDWIRKTDLSRIADAIVYPQSWNQQADSQVETAA